MRRVLPILVLLTLCTGLFVWRAAAQDAGGELTILLSSPGEGETFYIAPTEFLTSVPVAGRVVSYNAPLQPETVEVTVELVSETGDVSRITTPVEEDGYFEVWASLTSPDALTPVIEIHEQDLCTTCHRAGAMRMPQQASQVVVRAQAGDGRTARATRRLYIDQGRFRQLTVQLEGLPEGAGGAQVQATALLYDWRRRTFFATLNGGEASLSIEGLSHADLEYQVSLVPFVFQGTLYTTPAESVRVPAGQEALPPLTLAARPVRGVLSGRVVDEASGEGVAAELLAVNLRTGDSQVAVAGPDGAFALDGLAIAEHALWARPTEGYHAPQRLDLRETPATEVVLRLRRAGVDLLRGTVALEDGYPLPFAQVAVEGLPAAHADPLTGGFELAVPDGGEGLSVEVAAAGCYGTRLEASGEDLGEVRLPLQQDTAVVERGGSRLYLPAASQVTRTDDLYTLESGVLWVRAEDEAQAPAFRVRVGGLTLEGRGADYAVERLAGAPPRLYVRRGEVLVTGEALAEPLSVVAGQLLTLEDEPVPVAARPGVGPLLRALGGSAARYVAAPSPAAQWRAIAVEVAVVAARILMLLAYGITFVVFPVTVLGVLIVYLRRRRS